MIICLTHDVDRVYKSYQYITKDIINCKFFNLYSFFTSYNPYWCFDKIIKIESKHQVRSTFFFLEESMPINYFSLSSYKYCLGKYKFNDQRVSKIIKYLDQEGWEIGLHGSYNSYKDYNLLKSEKVNLENILTKKVIGVRQHYLNLQIPETWNIQKNAGFEYDTSFGLKNDIGFPNKIYRPFVDENSGLYVIPITIMDGYLFKNVPDYNKAWEICFNIMDEAEINNAVLTVLWHQRVFNNEDFPYYSYIYEKIIKEGKRRNAEFCLCRELISKINKQ